MLPQGQTIDEWYKSIPQITKFWTISIVVLSVCSTIGLIDVRSLLLNWSLIKSKAQIYRFLTCFMYEGQISFHWIFNQIFQIGFSSDFERSAIFAGSRENYLFFLLIQQLMIIIICTILFANQEYLSLSEALRSSIVYSWSKLNSSSNINFWGFTITAAQVPILMLLITFFSGGNTFVTASGMLTAHIHLYLLNESKFKNFFCTPSFVFKLMSFIDNIMLQNRNNKFNAQNVCIHNNQSPIHRLVYVIQKFSFRHDLGLCATIV